MVDSLGDDVVLDIGASFAVGGAPLSTTELPTFWPGRFVLHVGGTRRCVVFDAHVDPRELARFFNAERDAYFANDFVPATE